MTPDPVVLDTNDDTDTDRIVERAVAALEAGEAVVVPTDTVYGVAAHLGRPVGLDRLFTLKDRDRSKALPVLVADVSQAWELLDRDAFVPEEVALVESLVNDAWPGALTLVGSRTARWRAVDLGGDPSTVGVRMPESDVVRAIAARVGPIATTSANRSGDPTPSTATAAAAGLAGEVALVIDAGRCDGVPSTVLDVTEVPFRILRHGGWDPRETGWNERVLENGTVSAGG